MTPESHDFDVVVVGCGVAGLSAAATASESGLRVAILERAPRAERGGNSRYTEAYLRMKSLDEPSDDFESHFAANAGGHLDPSLVALTTHDRESWPPLVKAMAFTDPDVITTFAENAGPTLRWLETLGVRFERLPTVFLTTSTQRLMPIGGGLALVETLSSHLEGVGVPFFYGTTARDLIQAPDGAITGVRAVGARNRLIEFRGAVVLACGGFQGNAEMMAQYVGPRALYLRPVARGGHYNKGEGIRMGLGVGAAPCGDFGSWHAEPIDPRSGISEPAIFAYPYGVLVNQQGQRFVDEASATVDATYEAVTRHIFAQVGGIAYMIADAKLSDVPNYQRALRTDQPAIEAGSLRDLAGTLAVPAAALTQTLEAFNAACRPGTFKPLEVDGLATEGIAPPKSNWARPIDRPPFLAYPMISSNVFTFGGLKVTPDAEVVNNDGEVIRGLYAAGETMGIYYGSYAGSTSVLRGLVFGRLAARHAAQLARAGR